MSHPPPEAKALFDALNYHCGDCLDLDDLAIITAALPPHTLELIYTKADAEALCAIAVAAVKHHAPEWTTTKPTVAGWYWYEGTPPYCVQVVIFDGEAWANGTKVERFTGRWSSSPITPPETRGGAL